MENESAPLPSTSEPIQPSRASAYAHTVVFWAGAAACAAGVALHLPMYLASRSMGYHMAGMRPDAAMLAGMTLLMLGIPAVAYGLIGRSRPSRHGPRLLVQALDDARITPAHVLMLIALAAAVVIDAMKTSTLAFVMPGMAKEYGLAPAHPHGLPVALLPLCGISGTVVGSLLWGWLGDRIGRRASILLAATLFMTTAICGAMPGFAWNLLMCFMMGLGVGGLLPIAFALIAEAIPARHRGWLMVLVGGNIAAAYVLTSWLSNLLIPHYSWRIMWLLGLPTGALLLAVNHWIPESPRFLLATGRRAEAQAIMNRFGVRVVAQGEAAEVDGARRAGGYLQLARPPLGGLTLALIMLGLAAGLITFGFQLWLPTNLQRLGISTVTSGQMVRDSSLLGFPVVVASAWAYGRWSSARTILLLSAIIAAALCVIAAAGRSIVHQHAMLKSLLAMPIWGIGALAAVLIAYGAEVYPTRLRSHGAGLTAAATKAGGVMIISLVVLAVATPSMTLTALIGAIPLIFAIIILAMRRIETSNRPLEVISRAAFRSAQSVEAAEAQSQ